MSEPIKRKASAAGIGREPALPVKPGMDKVASKLTRQARARLRRGNVPDTKVARADSVNRMDHPIVPHRRATQRHEPEHVPRRTQRDRRRPSKSHRYRAR